MVVWLLTAQIMWVPLFAYKVTITYYKFLTNNSLHKLEETIMNYLPAQIGAVGILHEIVVP